MCDIKGYIMKRFSHNFVFGCQIKSSRRLITSLGNVWERGCGCVLKKFEIFSFLLKFNIVCTFWIVLIC